MRIPIDSKPGRLLPQPPMNSSPKETNECSITIANSGLGSGQDQLSRKSKAASISPVAQTSSHLSRCRRISSDQSQGSDDEKLPQGSIHSSPVRICQQSHSLDYKPSSISDHEPHHQDSAWMNSGGSTQARNPPETSPQVDTAHSPKPKASRDLFPLNQIGSPQLTDCQVAAMERRERRGKRRNLVTSLLSSRFLHLPCINHLNPLFNITAGWKMELQHPQKET